MEKYIVIKKLPDAKVGTEVNWDENENCFWYNKSGWTSPNDKNYLSAEQVTQSYEYFCLADKYPEYYAFNYPVYSINEILKLVNEYFPVTIHQHTGNLMMD